jgi:integrase
MAIPKEYSESIEGLRGLKATKDFRKYYYRFKINGKEHVHIFNYNDKHWTPKDLKKNARTYAETYQKQKEIELKNPFNPDTKVGYIADQYFINKCTASKWTEERKRIYELHIKEIIGNKKISAVLENDIDKIRKRLETTGCTKQNENGSSIRTIEKVLFQVLKPILEYARNNGAIDRIPQITIPARPKKSLRKKIVKDGTEKIVSLFNAIETRYQNDPLYRGLFYFALFGRRWNEIATLEWSDIDFEKKRYTIRSENNKIGIDQDYYLPAQIASTLLEINDDHTGLVFKSTRTGGKMHSPRKQLAHLIIDTGIEELTMHYFRHIYVTALGEQGAAATVLSAALGHIRSDTVDAHYRTIAHYQSSESADSQLQEIIGKSVPNTKVSSEANRTIEELTHKKLTEEVK